MLGPSEGSRAKTWRISADSRPIMGASASGAPIMRQNTAGGISHGEPPWR